MNVNSSIMALKDETGLPVAPDIYEGSETKWITFVYEDERPVLSGDNAVLADRVYLQVQLWTPKDFNYMSLKEQIRDYLEEIEDCTVTSIRSFVNYYTTTEKKMRQTIFNVEITQWR